MEKILCTDSNTKCSRSLKTNRPRELSVAPSTSAASTRSTPAASGPVRGSASPQRSGKTCGRGKVVFTGLARIVTLGPVVFVAANPFQKPELELGPRFGPTLCDLCSQGDRRQRSGHGRKTALSTFMYDVFKDIRHHFSEAWTENANLFQESGAEGSK